MSHINYADCTFQFEPLFSHSGELFAQCPVEAHPGIAVEPVMDSSRYFVLRIKDDSGDNFMY